MMWIIATIVYLAVAAVTYRPLWRSLVIEGASSNVVQKIAVGTLALAWPGTIWGTLASPGAWRPRRYNRTVKTRLVRYSADRLDLADGEPVPVWPATSSDEDVMEGQK